MRTTVVLAALVVLAVSLAESWWAGSVGCFVAYVIWTFVRIPLERRQRLRTVDPLWGTPGQQAVGDE